MKVLLVTPFPKKDEDSVGFSGLAGYSKRLLEVFPKNIHFDIACQKNVSNYKIGKSCVFGVWKRNSLLYFLQIFLFAVRKKYKNVYLHHEVYAYGTNQYVYPYLFILLVFLLRLFRKNVTVLIHGVLPISMLESEFIKKSGVVNLSFLVKMGSFVMYYFTSLFSSTVVVHNSKLKKYLVKDYKVSRKKIVVIPHPLYHFPNNQKESKRFHLLTREYEYIFLYFGYLSMYKSIDFLISSFNKIRNNSNCCLLIAGDIPQRLKQDKNYINWVSSLKDQTKETKNIVWDTRFIPDQELRHYFTNSSALIIPYQYLVSASGPLSYAVYAKLPVLASKSFDGVVDKDLIFGSSEKDLSRSLRKFFNDRNYRSSLEKSVIKQKHLWSDESIRRKYVKLFGGP